MTDEERLTQVRTRLTAYYAAETAILTGQEYRIGTRSLTRADLGEVRKAISDLQIEELGLVSKTAGGGRRWAGRVIPRDL